MSDVDDVLFWDVAELIDEGVGQPFAPNGRRFKQWVIIPGRDETLWETLATEALDFATGT